MKAQMAIQNLLREKLVEIQRTQPRYSLRAFAGKVGVHVGALTYIINGKRNISRKLAERITRKLLLDPQQRSEILGLFPEPSPKRVLAHLSRTPLPPEAFEPRFLQLSASQFKICAEWEHFAVMSLARCQDFQSTAEWIASRLGITPSRARQVVSRLLELGLLESDSEGNLRRSEKSYQTSDDGADISLKRHHEQSLDLAKESLHRDSVAIRDFTSITLAIDPKKISAAKERIRKFEDELSDFLERGHQTEVYRLSVQLFPLSKLDIIEGDSK